MMIGFLVPVMLFVWCCAFWTTKRKSKNTSLEELKNFYWLKNSDENEKIERKYYSVLGLIGESIYWGVIILVFLVIPFFKIYNFSPLKSLISSEAFWNILAIDIQILTVISLIIVLKKDYYLGITIKEVMKAYRIPDLVIKVLICSCIIFLCYSIYNIIEIRNNEIYSILVECTIYSFMFLMLINLIVLIYRTITICINNSKKEIETFKCLRYKMTFENQLKQEEAIKGNVVEKISTYLVNEVKRCYKSFRKKSDKLVEIQYGSAIVPVRKNCKNDKKYNRKIKIIGIVRISFFAFLILSVFIVEGHMQIKEKKESIGFIIAAIVLVLVIIILGAVTNVWNIVAVNRSFFVFKYEKGGKTKLRNEKIAAFGFGILYSKRYNFIGAIEDLASFYKILLYNKQGKKVADIIVRQVEEKIKEEEKIKNTILLLLYYFNYEKYYLKNEVKVDRKIKGKDRIEAVRKKTEQKIDKNKIYDYDEMKIWMENISRESVEYQLADSILKEAYKEPEIKENGEINPEKLKNYKFEYYFEFISSKIGNSCSKDKQKNENSNFSKKSNSAEAIQ